MPTPEQYRRKLAHIQPKNAVLFITFRLKGTILKEMMQELSDVLVKIKMDKCYDITSRIKAEDDYYNTIEDILDSAKYGFNWLKEKEVSQTVKESLHFMDSNEFKLICYCIMSNHVHFIAYNFKNPVYKTMNLLKSFTQI